MKAITTLAVLAALLLLTGIAGTPDYVLDVERENAALRAKLARVQNAQLQCKDTLLQVAGVVE